MENVIYVSYLYARGPIRSDALTALEILNLALLLRSLIRSSLTLCSADGACQHEAAVEDN
jgi:hypothetical protein